MTDQDLAKISALVGVEIAAIEQRLATRRSADAAKTKAVGGEIVAEIKALLERTLKPLVARIVELERKAD